MEDRPNRQLRRLTSEALNCLCKAYQHLRSSFIAKTIEGQHEVVQGLLHEMSGIEDRLQQSFASHFGAQTARIEELLRARQGIRGMVRSD